MPAGDTVHAELEAVGKPVGAYDVLFPGQVGRRDATLLTKNTKEFARMLGLKRTDGAAYRR
jgi:tRNA(fMet)-specific endonuclease VapC